MSGYSKETHYGIDYRIVGSVEIGRTYIKDAHQFYVQQEIAKRTEPVWFGMRQTGTVDRPISIRVQNIEGSARITIFADEPGGEKYIPDRPRPRSVVLSEEYVPYIVTYELTGRDEYGYLTGYCNGMQMYSRTFDNPTEWIDRFGDDRDLETLERDARDLAACAVTEDPMPGSVFLDVRNMGVNPIETSYGYDTRQRNQSGSGENAVYTSSCSSQLQTPLGEPLSDTASLSQTVVNTLQGYGAPYPMSCMAHNYLQTFSRSGSAYLCGMGQACFYDSDHYGMLYQYSQDEQSWYGCVEASDVRYRYDGPQQASYVEGGWPECIGNLWWAICDFPVPPPASPKCDGSTPTLCWCDGAEEVNMWVNSYSWDDVPTNFRQEEGQCLHDTIERPRAMTQGDGWRTGLPWHSGQHILSGWFPSNYGYVALRVNGEEIVLWERDLGYETMGFYLSGYTNRSSNRGPCGEPSFGYVDTGSGDGSPVFGKPYEEGEERLNRQPRDYDSANHPVEEYRNLSSGESGLSTMKYYYLDESRQIFIYSFFVREFPKTLDMCYEIVYVPEIDTACWNYYLFSARYPFEQACAGGCPYTPETCSGPLYDRYGGHPFQLYSSVMLCESARFVYGIYYAGDGWNELQGNHMTTVYTTPSDIWDHYAEKDGNIICHDIGLAKRVALADQEIKPHPIDYSIERAVEGEPL